ncbi:MAG: MFS transporter [Rhodobacterales bacterium]|jgi:DHA1 family tetracycline resistance protein-like MFS transporter|tara:strand:- start:6924 stop:8150 length:1227 start_codon:yes stop_codon:yes gene_type:complete
MNKRLAFTFIIITLTIDAMGIGLIIPVMPDLLQQIEGGDLGNAAIWGGILATVFAVMQFIFGPTIGSLSDRFGRRPVLLVSLVIIAVDFIVMGLAHSIWLLVFTRIIGGIAAATQATAAAFISDISTPENRSANFGILGATFGVGFVLGPLMGGLLGEVGLRVPFFAAAALATLNLILGYFVLPETVTDQTRRPFDIKRANPLGALTQIRLIPGLSRFLLVFFLYEFAFYVYPAVWVYYAKAQFGWDSGMLGVSLASFGISVAVVEGILIRRILPWLGERRTIVLGFIFSIGIFVVLGFLTSGFWALLLAPISALGSVVIPAMRGIFANKAEANQQGEIQGIVSSTQSLAVIFAPLVLTYVFYASTRPDGPIFLPGAPFLLAAAIVGLTLTLFVTRPKGSIGATKTVR